MDRDAIALEARRQQVEEMLGFERDREQTLREQIELVIGEADGPRIDAAAFARMSREDVEIVSAELDPPRYEEPEPVYFERDDLLGTDELEPVDPHAEELARLTEELDDCRRRQRAFEAYLEALADLPSAAKSASASEGSPG